MVNNRSQHNEPSSDGPQRALGRRPVLGSIAALGAGSAIASMAAAQPWPDVDDPYYATLANDLSARGLPAGEFCYGTSEAETMAAYDVIGNAEATAITPNT